MNNPDASEAAFYPNNWIILGQLFLLTVVFVILSQFSKKGLAYRESDGKFLFTCVLLGITLIVVFARRVTAIRIQRGGRVLFVTQYRFFLRSRKRFDLAEAAVGFVTRKDSRGREERLFRIESPGQFIGIRSFLSGWTTTALNEVAEAVKDAQAEPSAPDSSDRC